MTSPGASGPSKLKLYLSTKTMNKKIQEMLDDVRGTLLSKRDKDGMWRGALSSSAISTSVSVFALYRIDAQKYKAEIERGTRWLLDTMKEDGSWGDSVESPSNLTATLLTYTSLHGIGQAPAKSLAYLEQKLGGHSEEQIIKGVLDYYGKDFTFSVPILTMCALSGIISNMKRIPPFPFELAVLPQRFFRFLNLPVVSYAIPALISIGILQLRWNHTPKSLTSRMREPFVKRTLKKLIKLQPEDGGFLEAAPLTAFCSMCLSAAGYNDHPVTQRSATFLVETQREDGSWPIDTDLAGWVTSLAGNALAEDLDDPLALAETIKNNITKTIHPFTGAPAGGWGWTNLSGSVPDGDDTSGALVALHALTRGTYCKEVGAGLNWLMKLQNNDGGMPTFCKGWGKLPFDRSSPDISAHAALAMGLWLPSLPEPQGAEVQKSFDRLLGWLEKQVKGAEGSGAWVPLWFGDQDAHDEKSPVYGTATLMDYLSRLPNERATALANKGIAFLLQAQNADGGWSGNIKEKNINRGASPSKVTITAKALAALSYHRDKAEVKAAIATGVEFLYQRWKEGRLYEREPIGLYFARLWYSEEMYNLCYLMVCLKRLIS